MAARIIIGRRSAGQPCKASAFCTSSKRIFFTKAEEDQKPTKTEEDSKPAGAFRLWKPSGDRVSSNPAACAVPKCLTHRGASKAVEDVSLQGNGASISPKLIQKMYSMTCSRSLSCTKNALLDLKSSNKPFPTQVSLTPSVKLDLLEDDGPRADVEAYDSKEDPRAFQKQRPEYKSLCYKAQTLQHPLSIEDAKLILQNVAVFKSSLKPGTVAEYLSSLSHLAAEQHVGVKSSAGFAMLCRYGVENIQCFSVDELITVLDAFVRLAIPPTHSMLNVYESECCRRAWDMNLNQHLLVADLWRCLGFSVPQYLESALSYVDLHWKELTLPQLVQLAYIIGEGRKAPMNLMKNLDLLVLKHLNSLHLEEVGAICLGFFKSNNGLSEHTMRKIGDKVCAQMADISNYALVNVLKMYRYTHVDHIDFLKQLGNVVPPRIPAMGTQGVMHLTLACSALHYLDERIMDAVAFSLPSRVAYCRSKDIAKFLWSFGCLNYQPPNVQEFYASLEEQMYTKMSEFQKFPEHLLTSLLALAFAKRFPEDLIDYALSPEFIQLTRESKFDLKKDLFTLDGTVEIECPDYTGNRLGPHLRQEVAEMLWNFAKKDILAKLEVVEAHALLEDMLGGPQYVKTHMILPHTRSIDLEVQLHSDRKPLPFNSEPGVNVKLQLKEDGVTLTNDLMNQLLKGRFSSQPPLVDNDNEVQVCTRKREAAQERSSTTGHHDAFSEGVPLTSAILNALTRPKASREGPPPAQLKGQPLGVTKLAIQVSSRNHYCYDSKHLVGLHVLKRRQLCQVGYTVVELPFWEWFPLLKRSRSEKLHYLRQKVFGFVV